MTTDVQDVSAERYPAATLSGFIADAMAVFNLPADDARRVAELMTSADLTGADAHGIFRLPQYARRLEAGGINPAPQIKVERRAPGVAVVDGDNGMGHLVMSRAAETAVALARETGIGWVGVRRSNHAGPAALYAEMLVQNGMVGIYSAVASANHMAIWGGTDPLLGTNPLAIGIPCGDAPPILLDIATTVVSYGTVKNKVLKGQMLPEGWMVNRNNGSPVTAPADVKEGLLLPIGGHKGSGLALALGILAGTLNGAAFGTDVVDFNADDTTETNTGHFILALDIERFMPQQLFASMMAPQLEALRSGPSIPGAGPIRIPGEQRERRRDERMAAGVPIPMPLLQQLDSLARRLGIATVRERLAHNG